MKKASKERASRAATVRSALNPEWDAPSESSTSRTRLTGVPGTTPAAERTASVPPIVRYTRRRPTQLNAPRRHRVRTALARSHLRRDDSERSEVAKVGVVNVVAFGMRASSG